MFLSLLVLHISIQWKVSCKWGFQRSSNESISSILGATFKKMLLKVPFMGCF